jgi:hypothetical protein
MTKVVKPYRPSHYNAMNNLQFYSSIFSATSAQWGGAIFAGGRGEISVLLG